MMISWLRLLLPVHQKTLVLLLLLLSFHAASSFATPGIFSSFNRGEKYLTTLRPDRPRGNYLHATRGGKNMGMSPINSLEQEAAAKESESKERDQHKETILDSPAIQKTESIFKNIFDSYNQNLIDHPYVTKVISSAVIGGLGDVLVQIYVAFRKGTAVDIDLRRLTVFSMVSGLYFAPVIHFWFNWLNSLPFPSSSTQLQKALAMISLDQTIGNVFVNGGFFYAFELVHRLVPPYSQPFSLAAVLEAGNAAIQKNLWSTMLCNWCSWPFINFLNFLYVPVQFRLLVSNVAAIFWNMYLSNTANTPVKAGTIPAQTPTPVIKGTRPAA